MCPVIDRTGLGPWTDDGDSYTHVVPAKIGRKRRTVYLAQQTGRNSKPALIAKSDARSLKVLGYARRLSGLTPNPTSEGSFDTK